MVAVLLAVLSKPAMNEIFLVLVSYGIILTFLAIEMCIFFAASDRYVGRIRWVFKRHKEFNKTKTLKDKELNRKKRIISIFRLCAPAFFFSLIYLVENDYLNYGVCELLPHFERDFKTISFALCKTSKQFEYAIEGLCGFGFSLNSLCFFVFLVHVYIVLIHNLERYRIKHDEFVVFFLLLFWFS